MNAWYCSGTDWLETGSLMTALGLDVMPAGMIAAVGAGGKTSTLFKLGQESKARGFKTAILTTTHMDLPDDGTSFTEDLATALETLNAGQLIVVGKLITEINFGAVSPEELVVLRDAADVLLVEADGSKRLPLKVPASHEPAIPAEADFVIVTAGLSAIGKPLAAVCHRLEQVKSVLGASEDHIVTPMDVARLLRVGYWQPWVCGKGRRGVVLLNQADTEAEIALGKAVSNELNGIPCVLTKYRSG